MAPQLSDAGALAPQSAQKSLGKKRNVPFGLHASRTMKRRVAALTSILLSFPVATAVAVPAPDVPITVTAKVSDGSALPGAIVNIYAGATETLLGTGTTNVSGEITLEVPADAVSVTSHLNWKAQDAAIATAASDPGAGSLPATLEVRYQGAATTLRGSINAKMGEERIADQTGAKVNLNFDGRIIQEIALAADGTFESAPVLGDDESEYSWTYVPATGYRINPDKTASGTAFLVPATATLAEPQTVEAMFYLELDVDDEKSPQPPKQPQPPVNDPQPVPPAAPVAPVGIPSFALPQFPSYSRPSNLTPQLAGGVLPPATDFGGNSFAGQINALDTELLAALINQQRNNAGLIPLVDANGIVGGITVPQLTSSQLLELLAQAARNRSNTPTMPAGNTGSTAPTQNQDALGASGIEDILGSGGNNDEASQQQTSPSTQSENAGEASAESASQNTRNTIALSGYAGTTGIASIGALDLETALLAVQNQRASLLARQLNNQLEAMSDNNARIARLLTAHNAVNAFLADPTDQNFALTATPLKEADITHAFTSAVGQDRVTQGLLLAEAIKVLAESTQHSQSAEMLRLNSLTNKRNEAFDIMTSFIAKMQETRSSVIGNMRSEPVYIGTVQWNNGKVSGEFDLSQVPDGEHHAIFNFEDFGITQIQQVTIDRSAAANTGGPQLADTGFENSELALFSFLLGVSGVSLVVYAARRRRNSLI